MEIVICGKLYGTEDHVKWNKSESQRQVSRFLSFVKFRFQCEYICMYRSMRWKLWGKRKRFTGRGDGETREGNGRKKLRRSRVLQQNMDFFTAHTRMQLESRRGVLKERNRLLGRSVYLVKLNFSLFSFVVLWFFSFCFLVSSVESALLLSYIPQPVNHKVSLCNL